MSYLGFFQQLSLHRGLAVEEIPGNRVREGAGSIHAECMREPVTVGSWSFTPLETLVMTPPGMRKQGSSSTHHFLH